MEEGDLKSPLLPPELGTSEVVVGWREVVDELKRHLRLAGPLIAVNLLQYCILFISLMSVRHLGETASKAATMTTSFATVTGFNIMMGTASTLDTFCGQAFGTKKYHMLGVYKQRAMLVVIFLCIMIAVIWANTGNILKSVVQDPEICEAAGEYATWMLPSIFAYGLLQCQFRFLQTQNIVFPMLVSSGITALVHLLLCWVLVFKSGLGFKGAALANSISYWMNAVVLAIFVRLSPDCKMTWTGFSKEGLHDIFNFIKLGLPSMVMLCWEFWTLQLMLILSRNQSDPKTEMLMLSICLGTASMVYMIPFGLGSAVSVRVSNELGAGRPIAARLAVFVVLPLAIALGLVIAVIMIAVAGIWGYTYSNEVELVEQISTMMPLLAISSMLNTIQSVLSGNARGCGWQRIAAFINVGSYYLMGIPSALVLAFVVHIGGRGMWMGITFGLFVEVSLLMTVTLCTDWEKEAFLVVE